MAELEIETMEDNEGQTEGRAAGPMADRATGPATGLEIGPMTGYEYSTLMHLLGVSVSKHLLDEHFTLVWANEYYYKLIGWPKSEYEARFHNRPDPYYRNDQTEWNELSQAVPDAIVAHQTGYQMVSRIRRRNGDHAWMQFSTRFADEYIDGYQVAYSVLTNIDKVAHIQKEQSVTYGNLPGFVTKYQVRQTGGDVNFTLLEANSRFLEYFGKGGNRVTNSLYRKNIQDNIEAINEYRVDMFSGAPPHFVMHVESRYGQALWLQISATCMDWQEGCPIYLAIFIDIMNVTEMRRMQKKLTEQTEALRDALTVVERADRAKSDFLSRMSHEIRTPMNAIIGMTAIAAAHIEERQRVEDCLKKIGYSSKHSMSLINDILDMSKIDEGKIQIAHEVFNLETVAESITSIIYPRALEKGLAFTVPLVELIDTVLVGDALRLNQALLNLLSNAPKFTPGGGTTRVEIRQLQRAGTRTRIQFIVGDTGTGMSREFMERLFTPFEQESAYTGKRFGGTDLGMAITENLVALTGGMISVKSEVEKGTAFTVELDFEVPEGECGIQAQKQPALESLKVLVSDDDGDSCTHTFPLLKNLGIQAHWVMTGEECVKKVGEMHRVGQDYNACLTDRKMPDIDSIEVTRRTRELVDKDTTIVIITAYDWNMIEQRAREAGVDTFLAKSILVSTLYNTLPTVTGINKAVMIPAPGGHPKRPELADRHVLLAEDNDLNREITMELLKMTSITVSYAENGGEALEKFLFQGDLYDLILMDVQMPVMDGYQTTEAIRRSGRPRAQTIPTIAMTASAFHEDVVQALAAGMDGHLSRPIDPNLLYQTLADMLGKND